MKRNTLLIAGGAIVAASALGVGGAALANAGGTTSTAIDARGGYGAPGYGGSGYDTGDRGPRGGGIGQGQGLSGETAVKVVQAAVAKEPTAVLLRAGKADDGTYRVSMRREDGTHIVLTLDANFTVTGTEERAAKEQRQRSSTPTPSTSATS